MHQISTLNGSQWNGTGNADHGNMFAVDADAIDCADGAAPVRHNQGTKAVDSRIRIGRVGRVEFVAISNPGRFTPVLELLHEFEIVIARHTEDVPIPASCKRRSRKFPIDWFITHISFQ